MAAGQGIGEFYISLLVDAAQGQASVGDLVQGMGALEISTLAEIGLLWELGVQLARMNDMAIQAALGFEQFTMHTGLSGQELQKWQIVADQSHASAQDVLGSVENLTKHLANLAVGIPDAALGSLQQLGITAFDASGKVKTAFEILGEVRTRLGAVSNDAGQQERILAGLGVSPNLRETLLLSSALFEQRAALAHGMTGAQEASFDKEYQALKKIELLARDIGFDIVQWISPAVILALEKTEKFFEFMHAMAESPKKTMEASNAAFAKAHPFESRGLPGLWDYLGLTDTMGKNIETGAIPSFAGGLLGPTSMPGGGGAAGAPAVTIDKHDTYIINGARNPEEFKDLLTKHWDDVLKAKTIDGFDRQTGQSGY